MAKKNYSQQEFKIEVEDRTFRLLTLFDWIPNQSNAISTLILNLKGNTMKAPWGFYTNEFLRLNRNRLQIDEQTVIVNSPKLFSKKTGYDHAGFFAMALGANLGTPVLDCLERLTLKEQKRLSIQERSNTRFAFRERYFSDGYGVDWFKRKKVIFVDDIVTTGFSSYSAYQALGKPKNFNIWAIAYRLKSLKNL